MMVYKLYILKLGLTVVVEMAIFSTVTERK